MSENNNTPIQTLSDDTERNRTMRTTRSAPVASTSPHVKGWGRADPTKPTAEQIAEAIANYKLRLETSVNADKDASAARSKLSALKEALDKEQDSKAKKEISAQIATAQKDADAADAFAKEAGDSATEAREARDKATAGGSREVVAK